MGDVNDPNNDQERLQRRLKEIEDLPREEYQVVRYWANNFLDDNAPSTLERHLGHLLTIRDQMGVSMLEATKFDWTTAISELEQERGWTSGTKRNYQKSVRAFLDEVEDEAKATPDEISLAKDDSGGKIDPDDILDHEEVRILIEEAANRPRDKAMFSILIDLGLRVAALCSLRIKDYDPQPEHGIAEAELNEEALGTKDSEGRTQVTTFSTAYIDRYLSDDHPRPEDQDAPLFHKSSGKWDEDDPDDDGSISPMIFRRRMKRLASDFDIDAEKLHPHNMKHAAVTLWAKRGMSNREIEHRAGWTRESGQLDRYEHLTDRDLNQSILEKHDIEIESEEDQQIHPVKNCPRCGYTIDPGFTYCGNCGQQLEQTAYPNWFKEYKEMYGEDSLVRSLKDRPSTIPQTPQGLDANIFQAHQNQLEGILGVAASQPPVPDDFQYELTDDDGDEYIVSVPRTAMQEEENGRPAKVHKTVNGILEVLDSEGSVVHRSNDWMRS